MVLGSLIFAAALAAPATTPVEAMSRFYRVVETRPAEACRLYLTPAARRQWDSFESLPCRWKRARGAYGDQRTFRVVARPSERVARVAARLLDTPLCGDLEPEWVSTVVRRDGRWRIARFGTDMDCVPPKTEQR